MLTWLIIMFIGWASLRLLRDGIVYAQTRRGLNQNGYYDSE